MSIVLKEHEWTEEMIAARSLGKKPSETLTRVARYYLDKGYNKTETRNLLDVFLLQCTPDASLPGWTNALNRAVKQAQKYEAVHIEDIHISRPEMERIDQLKGVQLRRLAFTLLCLAKYRVAVNPTADYWVRDEGNEIMALANINTSVRRQCALYRELRDNGIIRFAKAVDNTSVQVLIAQEGEVVLRITDLRNLGYQYLRHHGQPYFECQNCGITTKIDEPDKGARQKYCRSCAVEVATQQRVNSVMRRRTKAA